MLKSVKSKLRHAALGLLATAALWLAAAPFLADGLVAERIVEKADAIVVLSGSADFAQRAQGAANAFQSGVAPRVLVTDDDQRGGWDDAEKGNPYFVDRTVKELIRNGVPPTAIERLPGHVHGTDEEADLVTQIVSGRGYNTILLVTSDYHSRRALWTFDRAAARRGGTLAVGLQRSPSGAGYPDRYSWWLSRRGWSSVAAEYLKFGYYWLFY